MTSKTIKITIPINDPTLPGHFPGAPIIPGALLLDIAVVKTSKYFGVQITEASNVKFRSPVLPGEDLLLVIEKKDETKAGFTYFRDEKPVVTGTLEMAGEGKI